MTPRCGPLCCRHGRCIQGETGCGKSTRVPVYVMEEHMLNSWEKNDGPFCWTKDHWLSAMVVHTHGSWDPSWSWCRGQARSTLNIVVRGRSRRKTSSWSFALSQGAGMGFYAYFFVCHQCGKDYCTSGLLVGQDLLYILQV